VRNRQHVKNDEHNREKHCTQDNTKSRADSHELEDAEAICGLNVPKQVHGRKDPPRISEESFVRARVTEQI
jgi:hypothetical protein